jgi:uncharacterized protein YegP (UPF0339 family)
MGAKFEIHNGKGGIAFRLLDAGTTLCTSARVFNVVCDAEKAIFAIKRNCTNPSRVREDKNGGRHRFLILAENGRSLAESMVFPAQQAARVRARVIQCCNEAQIVDVRPNKRGGPGACVIG